MRLDRWLAHHIGSTRKEVDRVLRAERVTVDGEVVRKGATHITPGTSVVALDGARLEHVERYVVMLHKPAGVVSATKDPHGDPLVVDLVPESVCPRALSPVGRLDKDATGLLLLTDDGDLVHAITHPKRGVTKLYEVRYDGALAADAQHAFETGVVLADGTRCKPARLDLVAPGLAHVTVHEGKYHQVKRMIAAVGAHVTGLHRTRVGPILLDPALPEGEARRLTDAELAALDAVTGRAASEG
ncbi:MAG: rRNA pseudouridine synthase [Deltaproteobacteria bacterium]|nr:rRNA pseudouridine synthase [Deltaproteobacteria bacterium]